MKAIDFSLIHSSQRKKRLRKDGTGPVWVLAYQAGRYKYYSTEVAVTPQEWNTKRTKVINHPNAVAYTAKVKRKLSELENYQIALINEHYGEHISLADFDERYRFTGGQRMSFTSFYELTAKQRKEITKETRQTQLNTLRHFKAAVGDIPFIELRYSTVESFHQFLLGEEKELTTIDKFHRHVKTYINLAINRGLMLSNSNPYRDFKYDKGRSKPRDFLRLEEIEGLEQLPIGPLTDLQIKARDIFVLMAFLGLRFSDAVALTPRHITKTHRGLHYSAIMKKNQRRAQKEISLPVYALFHFHAEEESRAQRWLKYCLKQYATKADRPLFSGLTNAKVNDEIKVVALSAGITKKLTTHVGRHSFGTNMAAANVPLPSLQSYMGHSKIETTMQYVHMARKIRDEVMEKIKFE